MKGWCNCMGEWIKISDRLPDPGVDVLLCFRDTHHTDPSWPRVVVLPAWRGNLAESPNGSFAIEGRLGRSYSSADIEDAIAWMPMPEPPDFARHGEKP